MKAQGFALYDTALGACGIAWHDAAIAGSQLPGRDEAATRERMQRRFPGVPEREPPPAVREVMDRVQALLRGEAADLRDVALDYDGIAPFERRVLQLCQALPRGETVTYGELAARAGDPGAARAVGQAMGHNPFAPIVPCHRVLAAGGRMGGFSAPGGTGTKQRMLLIEQARPPGQPSLF